LIGLSGCFPFISFDLYSARKGQAQRERKQACKEGMERKLGNMVLTSDNRGMQDCFRQHPDTYGDELADPGPPDDIESEIAGAVEGATKDSPLPPIPGAAPSSPPSVAPTTSSTDSSPPESQTPPPATLPSPTPSDADIHPAHTTDDDASKTARARSATEQVGDENADTREGEDELVTKEWHDTTKLDEKK